MNVLTAEEKQALPYRPNVGLMLINQAGKIFAGRRIDMTIEAWQMPQGGIDAGETAETAALRELKEETGTDKAEIIREHSDWLYYDLPEKVVGIALHGKYKGQKQKWMALRFTGTDADINIKTEIPEFSEWQWMKAKDLMVAIVPFKREIYGKVFAEFSDLLAD